MMFYVKKYFWIIIGVCFLSCSPFAPIVPEEYDGVEEHPHIYPDYIGVTVPCNIAPLTFRINEDGVRYVTRFVAGDSKVDVSGMDVRPSISDWRMLVAAANGGNIDVDVYVKKEEGWLKFAPFKIAVSSDSIDPYISYRLIPPSYVAYENLSICQRALSSYDESVVYHNMLGGSEPNGQCINCHAYKNYRTDNMQFHVRQYNGGTVFVHDGELKKLNLKTDSTISAGVYPSFNPKYDVVAYSVNSTGQIFHTKHPNKVEVQDKESDVIVYNPIKGTVKHVANSKKHLEVFPSWSPDGKMLYYCSAHFEQQDTSLAPEAEMIIRYKEVKYDVLRRSWDPETGEFGEEDTVFLASEIGKSATFPRISPNGRYLLFAMAEYGCFHIWHKDADLYVMDLETNELLALDEANSEYPESYHSWSSNGRWILFASRRDDTNYSRLYIAHIDDAGKAEKAFLLPQKSPEFYDFFDRSYNVPEFMLEPVCITPQEFADVVSSECENVKYEP